MNKIIACVLAAVCVMLASIASAAPLSDAAISELRAKNGGQLAEEKKMLPTVEPAVIYTFVGLSKPNATAAVLEKLKEENIKATFFVFDVEMTRQSQEVAKIIAEGHEIGLAINAPKENGFFDVCRQIQQGKETLQSKFGLTTRFIKQPWGAVSDETREAVAAMGCELIGQTVNVVQSRHKEYQTAEAVMKEIFGARVYSVGRGQIVNIRMDFYTNPSLAADMLKIVKEQKIDNIAYRYYDDNPDKNPKNDSAYKVKGVGAVANNKAAIYEYPVRLENVPQNLQKGKIDYTDDTFLENLMKRYIGAPSVNADDRTIGFSGREVRRLDETGCIHTDENVVFLTFDDWGHDTSINKLMYVLRKHNVNGTFFIITNNTLYNPNLLRAIAQDGNEIASHSDKHRPMVVRDEKNRQVPTQNEEEYHEDLGLAYDKLVSVTGDVVVNGKHSLTRFFRPPTLAISKMGIKALFDNGYEYIVSGWYSTEDYKAKDTEQMVKRIYGGIYERDGKIRKGSIIVMHMSEPAAYTARALDLILTANEKRADGDPLKFKVGLLGDYLKDDYCQLPYRKQAAEK